jgi:hypothetical protein
VVVSSIIKTCATYKKLNSFKRTQSKLREKA